MSFEAPKSAGCLVSWEDLPRIYASITVYGACLGFGAGIAVLGASVPQLADGINVPDTGIGRMFVYRGVGFLLGALLSIKLLRVPNLYFSKHMICCVLILVAGLSLSMVPVVAQNYPAHTKHNWVLVTMVGSLFFVEGMCFGGIDAFSALAISEMWGQRTQPWMQTKNLFANFGCLIGPALVDGYGYHHAYLLIALLGCVSMAGFALDFANTRIRACLKLPAMDQTLVCAELGMISHALEALDDPFAPDDHATENEKNEWDDLVLRVMDDVEHNHHADRSHNTNLGTQNSSPRGGEQATTYDFSSPRKRTNTFESTATPMHSPSGKASTTLTFASPELARCVRHKLKPVGIVLVPHNVRLLLALFVFWDLGLLCAYGAWVSTYVETFDLDDGMGHSISEHDAQSAAAQVLAIFYATQILGSILSVPASVIFSTTALLRCQLVLAVAAGVLMCIPHVAFSSAGWLIAVTGLEAGLMGLALGCMYPLIMTVVNDYGATMTSNSTIAVVLGGCIGEAAAPFVVSLAIANFGPGAFVVCICALIVALVVTYVVLHVYLKYTPVVQYRGGGSISSGVDVESGEGGKELDDPARNMLRSGVFGRSANNMYNSMHMSRNSHHTYTTSDMHHEHSESKHTESPHTLMNYTGFSRVNSCTSIDGIECEDTIEIEPLVLPSTRYHTVRANGNVSMCHSPGGSENSGRIRTSSVDSNRGRSRSNSGNVVSGRIGGVYGNGNDAGGKSSGGVYSVRSGNDGGSCSPGIAMIPMHTDTSPHTSTSYHNSYTPLSTSSNISTNSTVGSGNLYVKSFRVPLFPAICNPGNGYEAVSSV